MKKLLKCSVLLCATSSFSTDFPKVDRHPVPTRAVSAQVPCSQAPTPTDHAVFDDLKKLFIELGSMNTGHFDRQIEMLSGLRDRVNEIAALVYVLNVMQQSTEHPVLNEIACRDQLRKAAALVNAIRKMGELGLAENIRLAQDFCGRVINDTMEIVRRAQGNAQEALSLVPGLAYISCLQHDPQDQGQPHPQALAVLGYLSFIEFTVSANRKMCKDALPQLDLLRTLFAGNLQINHVLDLLNLLRNPSLPQRDLGQSIEALCILQQLNSETPSKFEDPRCGERYIRLVATPGDFAPPPKCGEHSYMRRVSYIQSSIDALTALTDLTPLKVDLGVFSNVPGYNFAALEHAINAFRVDREYCGRAQQALQQLRVEDALYQQVRFKGSDLGILESSVGQEVDSALASIREVCSKLPTVTLYGTPIAVLRAYFEIHAQLNQQRQILNARSAAAYRSITDAIKSSR